MQLVLALLVTCSKSGGKTSLLTIWVNSPFSAMYVVYVSQESHIQKVVLDLQSKLMILTLSLLYVRV